MTKGKYKRKRERAKQQAKQEASKAVLLERSHDGEKPDTGKAARQEKKEPHVRFGERFKNVKKLWQQCSLTDRIVAVFTAVLATAAVYQYAVTRDQLKQMKIDQRAWIYVIPAGIPGVAENKTPIFNYSLIDGGKTAALDVSLFAVIDIVANGESPKLGTGNIVAATKFSTGLMLPNIPLDKVAFREKPNSRMDDVEDAPLTHEEYESLLAGMSYLAFHGAVTYHDVFGTAHETRFCGFWNPLNGGPFAGAKDCTDYNWLDNN
jgi:hypothetical protein